MICPKCNTQNNPEYKFCKNCGMPLIADKQSKSPVKQTKFFDLNRPIMRIAIGGLLIVIIIILGVLLINTQNQLTTTRNTLSTTQSQLTSTQNQLTVTRSQLATAQDQLATTKNLLASVQNQLATTQDQLANAHVEITKLTNTDNGQVINAKTTLAQFLSDAKANNYQAMWAMLSTECQALYSSESDFESNNSVSQKDGYYLLDSYYIGSGSLLPSWNNYSNVPEIQVALIANENPVAQFILSLIPIVNTINGMIPTTEVTSWNAHCIKVGNEWKIYCERKQ